MSTPLTAAAADLAAAADKAAIQNALIAANGNVSRAALALNVPRRTLDKRINAHGLRDWLTKAYPLGARQPRRAATTSSPTPSRPRGRPKKDRGPEKISGQ